MLYISSYCPCGEDYFECLGEKAPNIGEGGKVFFWSKSEGMIWIGRIFSGLISFGSGQLSAGLGYHLWPLHIVELCNILIFIDIARRYAVYKHTEKTKRAVRRERKSRVSSRKRDRRVALEYFIGTRFYKKRGGTKKLKLLNI
jgi:hypothetical protein